MAFKNYRNKSGLGVVANCDEFISKNKPPRIYGVKSLGKPNFKLLNDTIIFGKMIGKIFKIIILFLILSITACSQTKLTPLSSENLVIDEASYPGLLLHISGEGPYTSEPFNLEGSDGVFVFWKNEATRFYVEMIHTNNVLARTPMGRVTLAVATGPSEYNFAPPTARPFEYIFGEYILEIHGEGTWEVWVQKVPIKN